MPLSKSSANPAAPPVSLTAWELPGVVHGFGGRIGGVGAGPFASFNLAQWVGDDPESVAENWRRWNRRHPKLRVALLSQVHGNLVHRVDLENEGDFTNPGERRQGDGTATAAGGLALAIFTADCVPILMVDPERRVAAALHAGWRGTLAGIAGEGVRAMVELGARPASIRAALGPSIGMCCFEVDAGLAETFVREFAGAAAHARIGGAAHHDAVRQDTSRQDAPRTVRPGKAFLDLRGIVRDQLTRAGLAPASIANIGPCTRCANDLYFSRRGAGGATSGLQLSFIALAE
jgi:purine-nucleoside/S-methyl-5'-thioadenosine phosphorylase / adenosine deaminase